MGALFRRPFIGRHNLRCWIYLATGILVHSNTIASLACGSTDIRLVAHGVVGLIGACVMLFWFDDLVLRICGELEL